MAILTRKTTITEIVDDTKREGFCFTTLEDNDHKVLETRCPLSKFQVEEFINQFKAKQQEAAPQPESEKPAQNEDLKPYPKRHEKKDSK